LPVLGGLPPLKLLMLRRVKHILPFSMLPRRTFSSEPAKRSKRIRSQLNRLAQQEPRIGSELLTFLAEGYKFKTIADYGIGSAIGTISARDAATAIDTAERFIDTIAQLLPP
jgi:hypothetical protein